MKYEELDSTLHRILEDAGGRFLTAYQICNVLENSDAQLWERLRSDYPSKTGQGSVGAESGAQYSPATFVSMALDNFRKKDKNSRISKEWLDPRNCTFDGIEPGYKGKDLSIWAWALETERG